MYTMPQIQYNTANSKAAQNNKTTIALYINVLPPVRTKINCFQDSYLSEDKSFYMAFRIFLF